MTDAKEAWDDVGEQFAELGNRIKEQVDARIAFEQVDNRKIDDALRTLVDAVDGVLTAIGDTMRDPEIRDDVKQAASSFGDAVASSLRDLGDTVRARFGSGARGHE